jgi:hypothetical protein
MLSVTTYTDTYGGEREIDKVYIAQLALLCPAKKVTDVLPKLFADLPNGTIPEGEEMDFYDLVTRFCARHNDPGTTPIERLQLFQFLSWPSASPFFVPSQR